MDTAETQSRFRGRCEESLHPIKSERSRTSTGAKSGTSRHRERHSDLADGLSRLNRHLPLRQATMKVFALPSKVSRILHFIYIIDTQSTFINF